MVLRLLAGFLLLSPMACATTGEVGATESEEGLLRDYRSGAPATGADDDRELASDESEDSEPAQAHTDENVPANLVESEPVDIASLEAASLGEPAPATAQEQAPAADETSQ